MFTVATLNVAATATVAPALAGLRVLSGAVGAFGGFLGNIASTALGVLGGQALFAGLTAGFQSAVGAAIGLNATLEDNTVAFTTLLHSGAAAQSFLGQLRDFAAATPFEFVGLAQTAKVMLGMGFTAQQIIPLLTDIGNVAAGLSLGSAGANRLGIVLGQMHTSGRVLGQDLLQLQQAGINTADVFGIMATQTGKSVPQLKAMQEAGKLPADWFITAFQTFSRMKFGGMLEAQAGTFTGIWENVKETLANTFGTIFSPLFQQLKELGKDILAFQQTATFQQWVGMLQGLVGQATTIFGAWRSTWGNLMKVEGLSFFQAGLSSLELVIRAVFGGAAAERFHGFLEFFQTTLPAAWTTLSGAWATLEPNLAALAGWLADTLPAAATQMSGAWATISTTLGPAVPLLEAAAGALGGMAAVAASDVVRTNLVPALVGIGVAAAVLQVPVLIAAAAAFTAMAIAAGPLFLLAGALGLIAAVVVQNWPAVKDIVGSTFSQIGSGIQAIIQAVKIGAGLLVAITNPAILAANNLNLPQVFSNASVGVSLWDTLERQKKPIFGEDTSSLPPAPRASGGTVDRSTTVTITNPVVRSDADLAAITAQMQAALAAAGQAEASTATTVPAALVGAE